MHNAINGLKLKIVLGSRFSDSALGNYQILKLHDSTQDTFGSPSTECLQMPLSLQSIANWLDRDVSH